MVNTKLGLKELLPEMRAPAVARGASVTERSMLGSWLDPGGNAVVVHSADAYKIRPVATVSRPPRPDIHLSVKADGASWSCGSATLDVASSSSQELYWVFPDGRISVWTRREGADNGGEEPVSSSFAMSTIEKPKEQMRNWMCHDGRISSWTPWIDAGSSGEDPVPRSFASAQETSKERLRDWICPDARISFWAPLQGAGGSEELAPRSFAVSAPAKPKERLRDWICPHGQISVGTPWDQAGSGGEELVPPGFAVDAPATPKERLQALQDNGVELTPHAVEFLSQEGPNWASPWEPKGGFDTENSQLMVTTEQHGHDSDVQKVVFWMPCWVPTNSTPHGSVAVWTH